MSSTSKPLPPASPAEVKKAAAVVAVGFLLIAAFLRWRGHPTGSASVAAVGLVLAIGVALPAPIGPGVHAAWMRFAHVVGLINSTIILSLLFFVIMTPLGLFFRLLGRDALGLRMQREDRPSYWTPKARPAGADSYFNQF